MKRRKFLLVAGGGVILAAGAAGGYVSTRTPDRALQPWKEAGALYAEPRRKALSYAILAPNPHNRQPWLVDLSTADQVVLYVDPARLLPHTDPYGRQIIIGLGCFLELLQMAAGADGYRVELALFPEGENTTTLDERPVAVARFVEDGSLTADPLFAQVLERRSLKEPYDLSRLVTRDSLDAVEAAATRGSTVGSTNEPAEVEVLRRLTHAALALEIETPRTYKESVDLFRIGKAEIEANPDGIDFSGPMFEAMHLAGLFTREAALDRSSTAYLEGRRAVLENTDTAMAHIWQVSRGNSRAEQIAAGRDWLRINLAATAQGLATQPLSQALQEYPEMKSLYDQAHGLLAPAGGTVQMLARLGYASAVPASPRWPLRTRIIGGDRS
ncbi:MAG TPA: twin-arginine translocation pathway signal protein [Kiloniellaceae bacterium]|nr:twin-arginine translocation pathway signal protein [Kiloniellaceae bacterium]